MHVKNIPPGLHLMCMPRVPDVRGAGCERPGALAEGGLSQLCKFFQSSVRRIPRLWTVASQVYSKGKLKGLTGQVTGGSLLQACSGSGHRNCLSTGAGIYAGALQRQQQRASHQGGLLPADVLQATTLSRSAVATFASLSERLQACERCCSVAVAGHLPF